MHAGQQQQYGAPPQADPYAYILPSPSLSAS
jgi:hypothetical protein